MPFYSNLLGSAGVNQPSTTYEISRSVRFNSADSAYLSRTPASAGNRKTWTWAGWVKLSKLPTSSWGPFLFSCSESINSFIAIYYDGRPYVYHGDTGLYVECNRYLRDFSAWYHICVTYDTTQVTPSNRIRLYINGSQATFDGGTQPTFDYEATNGINSTLLHHIGKQWSGAGYSTDAYLADVHFIDGQALDPTSFGEFDANGVWQPIAYAGSYGTNGFHLPYSDNSTAAALGTDTSGNGNDWTANNFTALGTGDYGGTNITPNSGSDIVNRQGVVILKDITPAVKVDYNTGPIGKMFDGSNANIVYLVGGSIGSATSFKFDLQAFGAVAGDTFTLVCSVVVDSGSYTPWKWQQMDASSTPLNSLTSLPQVLTPTEISQTLLAGARYVYVTQAAETSYNQSQIHQVKLNGVALVQQGDTDSLVDTPTNYGTDTGAGGEVRGNYATLNPLDITSGMTLSNGNLEVAQLAGADKGAYGTIGVSSGKWYWEVQCTAGVNSMVGIADLGKALAQREHPDTAGGGLYYYQATGGLYGYLGGSFTNTPYGAAFASPSDVVGIALDMDNGNVNFYKNGVDQGVANTSSLLGKTIVAAIGNGGATASNVINFGQRPFAYPAPSGYKALCTTNLPEPTIADGSTATDVKLYTGNGSTQAISGLGFSPDLVWIKNRAAADNHKLLDTIRGATNELESNTTDAEVANADGLTAFNSDGFDLGADVEYNTSTEAYVAWTWDAGSSTVSNTDGSITSSVRANASAGFSIVTYTGNGTAGATVGHGLNVAPEMIIVKNRDQADAWQVYHTANIANPETVYLVLDTPAGIVVALDRWNDTAPGASVFTLGDGVEVNTNTEDYVAYCFTGVSGYSSFGSYTGNGSVINGPFVYTGFRPKWILVKASVLNNSWQIYDSARNVYNLTDNELCPDRSDVENGPEVNGGLDFLSNGFKVKSADSWLNTTSTYIYAAFAENPFKTARAR